MYVADGRFCIVSFLTQVVIRIKCFVLRFGREGVYVDGPFGYRYCQTEQKFEAHLFFPDRVQRGHTKLILMRYVYYWSAILFAHALITVCLY